MQRTEIVIPIVDDLVKVSDAPEMKSRNLSGMYGYIKNIDSEKALVEFNDFCDWIPITYLAFEGKSQIVIEKQ